MVVLKVSSQNKNNEKLRNRYKKVNYLQIAAITQRRMEGSRIKLYREIKKI